MPLWKSIICTIISILVILGATLLFIGGWLLSIYHAFSGKSMTKEEKESILFFTIFTVSLIGFIAAEYIIKESKGVWIIFPILNFLHAFILLSLYRVKLITTESILDKQAKQGEIILGSLFVFIIFFISNYILKNHWSITFSICTSYATIFNEMLSKIFIKKEMSNK